MKICMDTNLEEILQIFSKGVYELFLFHISIVACFVIIMWPAFA